jgi:hypothetical protein
MPNGYNTQKELYRNQLKNPGNNPLKLRVKNEYRITSVTLHAVSILEYTALLARNGKGVTMPQTSRIRDATCIVVVKTGALTTPISTKPCQRTSLPIP